MEVSYIPSNVRLVIRPETLVEQQIMNSFAYSKRKIIASIEIDQGQHVLIVEMGEEKQ